MEKNKVGPRAAVLQLCTLHPKQVAAGFLHVELKVADPEEADNYMLPGRGKVVASSAELLAVLMATLGSSGSARPVVKEKFRAVHATSYGNGGRRAIAMIAPSVRVSRG